MGSLFQHDTLPTEPRYDPPDHVRPKEPSTPPTEEWIQQHYITKEDWKTVVVCSGLIRPSDLLAIRRLMYHRSIHTIH